MWHSILFSNYIIFFTPWIVPLLFLFLIFLKGFLWHKNNNNEQENNVSSSLFFSLPTGSKKLHSFYMKTISSTVPLRCFYRMSYRNEQLYKWILIRQYVYWRTDVKISVFVIKPLKCLLDTLVLSTFYDATWDFLAFDVSLIL